MNPEQRPLSPGYLAAMPSLTFNSYSDSNPPPLSRGEKSWLLLQSHPLWPKFTEWADSSKPLVDFDNALSFNTRFESPPPGGWPAFWEEPKAREYIGRLVEDARLLACVLSDYYSPVIHCLFYSMIWHPLGRALCSAARHYYTYLHIKPEIEDDFLKSTYHDGFLTALEAWEAHFLNHNPTGEKLLAWTIGNREQMNEAEYSLWLSVAKREMGDSKAYTKIIAKAEIKAEASERMRNKRGKKPKKAQFKDVLKCLWVPAALWCKSDDEILAIIAPGRVKKPDIIQAYGRLQRDISTLRFTASRCKPL